MSQLKQLTTERLAEILHEELDRDDWGDVDPFWIRMVSEGNHTEDDEHHEDAEALANVLDRVVARLKEDYE